MYRKGQNSSNSLSSNDSAFSFQKSLEFTRQNCEDDVQKKSFPLVTTVGADCFCNETQTTFLKSSALRALFSVAPQESKIQNLKIPFNPKSDGKNG